MNFASPIATNEQRDLVLQVYNMNLGWSANGRVYSDSFLDSQLPRIQAITKVVKELGPEVTRGLEPRTRRLPSSCARRGVPYRCRAGTLPTFFE